VKLIDILNNKIPSVLLGSSPFIGAGQFGAKSLFYYQKFYLNPKNIKDIVLRSIQLGITGIQILADEKVLNAVLEAQEDVGVELAKVVTLGMSDLESEIKMIESINPQLVFIHANIADSLDLRLIKKLKKRIKDTNTACGIATHNPSETIEFLQRFSLNFDAYMVPVNKLGRYMGKDPKHTLDLIKNLKQPVIAKKVLAAGKIPPEEAFSFIKGIKSIKGVAIGIASLSEAELTFKVAKKFFGLIKAE
jgi:hypothetical protein